jgi:mediator of RNA polymerase II transcription subunit 12, fungi type
MLIIYVIFQRICLALPGAFVSPRSWMVQSELIRQVLTEDIANQSMEIAEETAREVQQTLLDSFTDLKKRNEAMLLCNLPTRGTARLGRAVSDIQVMISIITSIGLRE